MLMARTNHNGQDVAAYRRCPHCKNGIGNCDGTKAISATLKRRGYKCLKCLKRWTVDVREEVINMRRKFQE